MTIYRPLGLGPNRPVDAQSGISVDSIVLTPQASLPATGVEGQQILLTDGTVWTWINGAWLQNTTGGLTIAEADARYRAKQAYVFTQGVASALWTVNHNLGSYPGVSVQDSTGRVVKTGVKYIDLNNLEITASRPFSGQAFLT